MDLSAFLRQDIGRGDLTTELTVPDREGTAGIVCQEDAVVAGLEEAEEIFSLMGAAAEPLVEDGARVKAGTRVMSVSGPLAGLITGERTALNFLMHMSGIATLTAAAVEATEGKVIIAATRKTTPGFGDFQKKAVVLGGGDPHRQALDSMVMIKDNHIKACGSVEEAMRLASKASFSVKVECEITSIGEAFVAAKMGADIIMADNMGPEETGKVREMVKTMNPDILVEASGNMDLEKIALYKDKADIISMGCLTHSAPSVQFSMNID